MRPLLTIAIPTYNRSEFLGQLLESLRGQLAGERRVQLLISDNASSDETGRTVEEARLATPLEYVRNRTNIGPDGNFLQCYEMARGKYVWIVSDDDLLAPGTVALVLDYIVRQEYDLVYIAPTGFNEIPPRWKENPSGGAARSFTDPAQFLRRVHVFTTLISSNIINKERVEAIGHKPFSSLISSNLIQLGWTFTALRGHGNYLFVDEKLVGYRLGNTGGYGVCRVFGETLARVTDEWLATPLLNELVLNASLQRLLPSFLYAANKKAHGTYDEEDPMALLSGLFHRNVRYWIFSYPLLAMPAWLAWCWLQLLRAINRIDRAFGYPSLGW